MKYPYSSPNLRIIDFIRAFFLSEKKADKIIRQYFSELTGKKYILITNSCRSALFLAYKSIGKTGDVITSPLTCTVAIDPITESGNKPVFADIRTSDLNINPEDISHRINENTLAIQVIHLGGVSCDMDAITSITKKNKLWIIEDNAQSLGAKYKDKNSGSIGDISCFSLIKNAYGIGGGILATDSLLISKEAIKMYEQFTRTPLNIIIFRTIKNILDTNRSNRIGGFLFKALMNIKGGKSSYKNVKSQLYKISGIEKKIAAYQIKRYPTLHHKRKEIGENYYDRLISCGMLENNGYKKECSSFTKFFLYNSTFNSKIKLQSLHDDGIEAMHLENKYGSPYQEQIVSTSQALAWGLLNYVRVHDCIISLPISESFKEEQLRCIIDKLQTI